MSTTSIKPIRFALIIVLLFSTTTFASSKIDRIVPNNYYVLFNVAEYEVTRVEYNRFKEFYIGNIEYSPRVTLTGHTDSDGGNSYNQRLSKARVEKVRAMLISFGYPEENIITLYRGEENPLNDNSNSELKRKNRRVEVSWDYFDGEIVTPEPPEELGDIQDLYDLLEQEKQSHCIDPTHDTILRLEQGTLILIPANSFSAKAGSCVTFKAKEVYKFSDMIMENLSTSSNGRLLETGGMVYTEATNSDGRELKLNPGKELTIMLPTEEVRDDMKLFYGKRDPQSQTMNWNLANSGVNNNIGGGGGGGFGGMRGFNFHDCSDVLETYDGADCDRCSFFFCRMGRIDETFAGIGNDEVKRENKNFRKCQKRLRKTRKGSSRPPVYDYCDSMTNSFGVKTWAELQDTLRKIQEQRTFDQMDKYGVETIEELRDTLNKISIKNYQDRLKVQMDEYGVDSYEELQDTLAKIQFEREEKRIDALGETLKTKESNINNLKYYVANVTRLGWMNCDAFYNVSPDKKIVMLVDGEKDRESDCNLIFKNKKAIMKSDYNTDKKFRFANILPELAIWILALKYHDGKAFLGLKSTTSRKNSGKIELKEISVDDLKIELRKLDL